MTDDLPPGDAGECPSCGGLLIVDREKRITHHGTPPCAAYLAATKGARPAAPLPFCCICKSTDRELRPYGRKQRPICFPCMKSDPRREREAQKWMRRALKRAGAVPTIIDGVGIISSDEAMRRGLPVQFVDTATGQALPRGAKG
jgi:hypothetical protein